MTRLILEPKPNVPGIERRLFLRQTLSLGALTLLTGCDISDNDAVQKVFYWGVLAAILVTILSGLSIWKPVQLQWLTWLFGGYEFARVVHFFGMAAIVAFLVVHIALTILVPKTLVAMVFGRASSAPHLPREAAND